MIVETTTGGLDPAVDWCELKKNGSYISNLGESLNYTFSRFLQNYDNLDYLKTVCDARLY